jgi:hypothetical protein
MRLLPLKLFAEKRQRGAINGKYHASGTFEQRLILATINGMKPRYDLLLIPRPDKVSMEAILYMRDA